MPKLSCNRFQQKFLKETSFIEKLHYSLYNIQIVGAAEFWKFLNRCVFHSLLVYINIDILADCILL